MFTSVVIQNFRALKHLQVPLRPLTVAIGANNTGKSTFLTALTQGARAKGRWGSKETSATFRGVAGSSVVTMAPSGEPAGALQVFLPSGGPPMQSQGVEDGPGAPALLPDGQNVPTLVDWMLRRDRSRFFGFVDAARSLVPGLVDVHVATPKSSMRRIDLEVEGGWVSPADDASAGVRLLLFFLALAWHPTPPDLVLIEEPENGLHPARLREVMDLIRGLVEGRHAPKQIQVVLTTHSPYLLSCVNVPEDQVLVFRRDADGSCTAEPVDMERIQPFLADFGLGEIWSNLGEAGLVKA